MRHLINGWRLEITQAVRPVKYTGRLLLKMNVWFWKCHTRASQSTMKNDQITRQFNHRLKKAGAFSRVVIAALCVSMSANIPEPNCDDPKRL